ncbi:hypothetical protein CJ030_MR4G029041 [Morella rubra]|uniref:Uncharacterized protein n=1 Tax=Morella rubra TaxID=262757 RepID=A0A6A1VU39_9ROSI|nr:hypothetical protein CJ030_MR4G029041 [Morella rubra]
MSNGKLKKVINMGESSRLRKRVRMDEESSVAHEIPSFGTGIHQQRFNLDFRNHKVISGRWVLFPWFKKDGFDFQEMFDYQGWSNFVGLKCDSFPYLLKQSFANFASTVSEDATSLVKGKDLYLSVTSINVMALSPNSRVEFFESYTWAALFDVESIEILRVVFVITRFQ